MDENDDCKYTYKKCTNVRSRKRDGSLHRLCDDHRAKANALQKSYAAKRRGELHSLREMVKSSFHAATAAKANQSNVDDVAKVGEGDEVDSDEYEPLDNSGVAAPITKEEYEYWWQDK
ncbi:Aste57867_4704 [Aphanomyces stellatus]|uniref:Aste57867_4704 protein n=1 Tax=Aphanomyces stellatus TaxID=120398 RepID=A0A485KFU4_9STRA|nr:hypothetical protein As57867_004691 [Aphanomyces stellatus]VFT81804.1 Aste57867_4704 [Aphanomyces stellatus]